MNERVKVKGAFLQGIINTFRLISAITSIDQDNFLKAVEPEKWYSIEILLDIFDEIDRRYHQPMLFYEAGAEFIRAWFEAEGKNLGLGSIGHIKLQDNSEGIKMVFKDYDPSLLYSKVVELDVEKGMAMIEICDILPKDFTYGVYYEGIYMWGDLLWLDVDIEVLEENDRYTKSLLKYRFKKNEGIITKDYIDAYALSNIMLTNALSEELPNEFLSWRLAGLKKELAYEKQKVYETKELLAKALASQIEYRHALEMANETIKEQSLTDFLTKVHNKRYFDIEFRKMISRASRRHEKVWVLMLDIDYFKRYNDFYGHIEGDEALIRTARAIKSVVKRSEDLFARFGGEEFIIAVSGNSIERIDGLVKRIQEKIDEEKIVHENSPIGKWLTLSIGSTMVVPDKATNIDMIISKADTALYMAKEQGRNRHVHLTIK